MPTVALARSLSASGDSAIVQEAFKQKTGKDLFRCDRNFVKEVLDGMNPLANPPGAVPHPPLTKGTKSKGIVKRRKAQAAAQALAIAQLLEKQREEQAAKEAAAKGADRKL